MCTLIKIMFNDELVQHNEHNFYLIMLMFPMQNDMVVFSTWRLVKCILFCISHNEAYASKLVILGADKKSQDESKKFSVISTSL